ncbi:hypothetical protein SAMN04489810_3477 [Microbacterium pygmaeum]|uniref:Uncharacterized protein n=1 Tax=Microbacterium pygmaeum TaxID=370764 RepID=A0A1G8DXJ0_9MICO|nr:hypothetical protein SAMN04489810_3477 [Microbacterium pygmaeum]
MEHASGGLTFAVPRQQDAGTKDQSYDTRMPRPNHHRIATDPTPPRDTPLPRRRITDHSPRPRPPIPLTPITDRSPRPRPPVPLTPITDRGPRPRRRSPSHRSPTEAHGPDAGPPHTDHRPRPTAQTPVPLTPTTDHRPPATGHRPPATGHRPPATGHDHRSPAPTTNHRKPPPPGTPHAAGRSRHDARFGGGSHAHRTADRDAITRLSSPAAPLPGGCSMNSPLPSRAIRHPLLWSIMW